MANQKKSTTNRELWVMDLCLFFKKFIGLDLENRNLRNLFFNVALEVYLTQLL